MRQKISNLAAINFIIWIFIVTSPNYSYCQFNLQAGKTSEQLNELIEKHHANISFDENLVSNCPVNSAKEYITIDVAIKDIASQCDLKVKKIGRTYVIIKPKFDKKQKLYTYSGIVFDNISNEPLSYSAIYFDQGGVTTNDNGRFTIKTEKKSIEVLISHMGYAKKKLKLSTNQNLRIGLQPANSELQAVDIVEKKIELLQNGPALSQIKLNHQLHNFLPGNRNNTLFNLMRLQSGIMASGEPFDDFVIRGSYKGFNHILFDDITIFNPSSLSQTVGEFNPMIIREIDVYKSGYQVDKGDRAHGLIHLHAKNGDSTKFHFDGNLSNQAFGNYFNFPLKKHGAIQLAYRVAFPDLIQPSTYNHRKTRRNFLFGDINLKYHGTTSSGDEIRLTMLANRNQYGIFTDSSNHWNENFNNHQSIRYQGGANFSYFKKWKNSSQTNFKLSYSISQLEIENESKTLFENDSSVFRKNTTSNAIQQGNTEISHEVTLKNQHIFVGGKYTFNWTNFSNSNLLGINQKSTSEYQNRFTIFFKDNISLSKYFEIEPGIKVDMIIGNFFPFWQPRIRLIGKPNEYWKVNFSYGIYNQFINENPLMDGNNNTIYYWSVGTENKTSAHHYIGGVSYSKKFFSGSIEAYYISTKNLNRYFISDLSVLSSQTGNAQSYGVDISLNFKILQHLVWASYSLRESKESFTNKKKYTTVNWAPQDQRHEFKLAGILKFHPFYISSNYIFGSGFRDSQQYHRLDIAMMYKYKKNKLNLETGFSILNVTNRKNDRLNNFAAFNANELELQRGIPISPSIFLRIFI